MPFSIKSLEKWNRKAHFYLGLYFLFFLWLFSLTGLLLNHDSWLESIGASARVETRFDRPVGPPVGPTVLDRARDVMRQLGLVGEIDVVPQQPGWLLFNTSRPSDAHQVRVNLEQGVASVRRFENGHWARFRILHTFSGTPYRQPTSERDWIVTTIWVVAMDALAAGIVVMILGSYYMWWRLKPRHGLGLLALAAGLATCGWFVSGVF